MSLAFERSPAETPRIVYLSRSDVPAVAVEDIACAAQVYMRARRQQLGTWLDLY